MRKVYPNVAVLLISLSFLSINTIAQRYSISGTILNKSDNKPLPGAHIYLSAGTDSVIRASVADASGVFKMENINPGSYQLSISFIGYKKYSQTIEIRNRGIEFDRIALEIDYAPIREVEVTGHVPAAVLKGDTTEYQADAFKTTPDADAVDLVEKMPGIIVEDGKVEAQGEEVQEVRVDGRPFFGNDPMAALRALPAEVIDKIQIFDRQSEQSEFTGFDDGTTIKTMNIITRIGMRNGTFGNAYAGIGYEDKYMAGGNINIFDDTRRITIVGQSNNVNRQNFSDEDLLGVLASSVGGGRRGMGMMGGSSAPGGRIIGGSGIGSGGGFGSGRAGGGMTEPGRGGDMNTFRVGQQSGISKTNAFGLNYIDKWGEKIDATGSYFFNMSNNDALTDLNRTYIMASDSGQVYSESDRRNNRNINHRMNLRINYNINENNSLLFVPRFTLQQNTSTSDVLGQTTKNTSLLNLTDNLRESDMTGANISGMILYRHKFSKEGRTFSMNLNTGYNSRNGDRFQLSENSYYANFIFTEKLDQFTDISMDGWSLSGNLMYTEPVGRNSSLMLTYDASCQDNESDRYTYDYDENEEEYDLLNTALSNTFTNNYFSQQVGTGYNYRKDKYSLIARVSYQNASLENNQHFPSEYDLNRTFNDVILSGVFRYEFSRMRRINVIYRSNTDPPSIDQLQEVVDNSNPVQLKTGNSDLGQSYRHMLFIRYSSIMPEESRVFFILMGGMYADNYIGNSIFYAVKDTMLPGNIFIPEGSQLTWPVNLDGQWNLNSFLTYGLPVRPIKSNLNFNISATISSIPGMNNNVLTYTLNNLFRAGIVLSSNISENIDFTITSYSIYNKAMNSLNSGQNTSYYNQNSRGRIKMIFWKDFVIETELNHQLYTGLTEGYNRNYLLWNGGIGKKLFKDNLGEIKFYVFDILKQNNSIIRDVNDYYIEDARTIVLQRYFMLAFTYNFRSFKT